jgi:hypothetical protein
MEEAAHPIESSFAGTLRTIAKEQQRRNASNTTQISVVPEPQSKRPRLVGSPLTVGGPAAHAEPVQDDPPPQPTEALEEKPKQPQPASAGLLSRAWSWLQKNNKFAAAKQLRVSETISLGEKRFVALVDIDGQKFLIGGGASGVSLLTQVGANNSAAEVPELIAAAAGQSK